MVTVLGRSNQRGHKVLKSKNLTPLTPPVISFHDCMLLLIFWNTHLINLLYKVIMAAIDRVLIFIFLANVIHFKGSSKESPAWKHWETGQKGTCRASLPEKWYFTRLSYYFHIHTKDVAFCCFMIHASDISCSPWCPSWSFNFGIQNDFKTISPTHFLKI